jgi:hypothetical protein
MEYSKEDLMEAKKQIWGVGENMGTDVNFPRFLLSVTNNRFSGQEM